MFLAAAGHWLLHSGIQEASGGFARFYDAEKQANRPVSTEISGYAASALVWMFRVTGDEVYLDAAKRTAAFLLSTWNEELRVFPFEWPSDQAYFFDTGIIIRGLLAVWRETGDERLLQVARAASHGMIAGFRADGDYHPILTLPDKAPLPRTKKWSRSAGCYQLKAAMAWWDVAEITGDGALRDAYLAMVEYAVAKHACFLREAADPYDAMDRLHAYGYFLEGLLPVIERRECRQAFSQGAASMESVYDATTQTFVRSDVCAQLMRARHFLSEGTGGEDRRRYIDFQAQSFQAQSNDPRIHGGFYFGRRDGNISLQVNPVSTAFAMQALEMQSGGEVPCRKMLI